LSLRPYNKKIYSQNGEDGIIAKIFEDIGVENSLCVEIGVEDGSECNTRLLREHGWSAIAFDCAYSDPSIHLYKTLITPENVNSVFENYLLPQRFDLLSIDIDGNDWYVWQALTYRPRVVVIEYNAGLGTEDTLAPYNPEMWDGTRYSGASLLAMQKLGASKGYTLIGADNNGVNAFFVLDEELDKLNILFSHKIDELITHTWKHPEYPLNRKWLTSRDVLPEADSVLPERTLTGKTVTDKEIVGSCNGGGVYLEPIFTRHIDAKEVNLILELGSGNGLDAIDLRDHYLAKVYAFECNQDLLPTCEENLSGQLDIELIPKVVWSEDGVINFHPVVDGNAYASSCFMAERGYTLENIQQDKRQVQATRLDTWCSEHGIEEIDLVCADLQGATLHALRGLGELLLKVKYIIAELEVVPMFHGEHTLYEVEAFLEDYGFKRKAAIRKWYCPEDKTWYRQTGGLPDDAIDDWYGDYLFVRSS